MSRGMLPFAYAERALRVIVSGAAAALRWPRRAAVGPATAATQEAACRAERGRCRSGAGGAARARLDGLPGDGVVHGARAIMPPVAVMIRRRVCRLHDREA